MAGPDMSMRKSTYQPGDWFAIPLRGGYAVGLLARTGRYRQCLGYFFGPLLSQVPRLEQLGQLQAADALWVYRFDGLRLENRMWPIIGRHPQWRHDKWPVPPVRHSNYVSPDWTIRYYADDLERYQERPATADEARTIEKDGVAGALFVELRLADLLGTEATEVDPFAALPPPGQEPPRHYLYFHDKELAEHAAEASRALGYEPAIVPSADEAKPFLLLANHKAKRATDEEMEQAAERLASVAAEWGGEYDGWDKPN